MLAASSFVLASVCFHTIGAVLRLYPGGTPWNHAHQICAYEGGELATISHQDIRELQTCPGLQNGRQYWTGGYTQVSPWIEFLGCFAINQTKISSQFFDIEDERNCYKQCKNNRYFGIQDRKCLCMDMPLAEQPEVRGDQCKMCGKEALYTCGTDGHLAVYHTFKGTVDLSFCESDKGEQCDCGAFQCDPSPLEPELTPGWNYYARDCRHRIRAACGDGKETSSNLDWIGGRTLCSIRNSFLSGPNIGNWCHLASAEYRVPFWGNIHRDRNYDHLAQYSLLPEELPGVEACESVSFEDGTFKRYFGKNCTGYKPFICRLKNDTYHKWNCQPPPIEKIKETEIIKIHPTTLEANSNKSENNNEDQIFSLTNSHLSRVQEISSNVSHILLQEEINSSSNLPVLENTVKSTFNVNDFQKTDFVDKKSLLFDSEDLNRDTISKNETLDLTVLKSSEFSPTDIFRQLNTVDIASSLNSENLSYDNSTVLISSTATPELHGVVSSEEQHLKTNSVQQTQNQSLSKSEIFVPSSESSEISNSKNKTDIDMMAADITFRPYSQEDEEKNIKHSSTEMGTFQGEIVSTKSFEKYSNTSGVNQKNLITQMPHISDNLLNVISDKNILTGHSQYHSTPEMESVTSSFVSESTAPPVDKQISFLLALQSSQLQQDTEQISSTESYIEPTWNTGKPAMTTQTLPHLQISQNYFSKHLTTVHIDIMQQQTTSKLIDSTPTIYNQLPLSSEKLSKTFYLSITPTPSHSHESSTESSGSTISMEFLPVESQIELFLPLISSQEMQTELFSHNKTESLPEMLGNEKLHFKETQQVFSTDLYIPTKFFVKESLTLHVKPTISSGSSTESFIRKNPEMHEQFTKNKPNTDATLKEYYSESTQSIISNVESSQDFKKEININTNTNAIIEEPSIPQNDLGKHIDSMKVDYNLSETVIINQDFSKEYEPSSTAELFSTFSNEMVNMTKNNVDSLNMEPEFSSPSFPNLSANENQNANAETSGIHSDLQSGRLSDMLILENLLNSTRNDDILFLNLTENDNENYTFSSGVLSKLVANHGFVPNGKTEKSWFDNQVNRTGLFAGLALVAMFIGLAVFAYKLNKRSASEPENNIYTTIGSKVSDSGGYKYQRETREEMREVLNKGAVDLDIITKEMDEHSSHVNKDGSIDIVIEDNPLALQGISTNTETFSNDTPLCVQKIQHSPSYGNIEDIPAGKFKIAVQDDARDSSCGPYKTLINVTYM